MKTIVKSFTLFAIGCIMLLSACKKEEYSFGELKNPSELMGFLFALTKQEGKLRKYVVQKQSSIKAKRVKIKLRNVKKC